MNDSKVKVEIAYNHDPNNLSNIYLAATTQSRPLPGEWRPAYRDTVKGKRTVFALFPRQNRRVTVWVRDDQGERSAGIQTV